MPLLVLVAHQQTFLWGKLSLVDRLKSEAYRELNYMWMFPQPLHCTICTYCRMISRSKKLSIATPFKWTDNLQHITEVSDTCYLMIVLYGKRLVPCFIPASDNTDFQQWRLGGLATALKKTKRSSILHMCDSMMTLPDIVIQQSTMWELLVCHNQENVKRIQR